MRLSAEQAQHAYDYLQKNGQSPVNTRSTHGVASHVIERALGRIASTPDPRPGRVDEARAVLDHGTPSSDEVAERILWRTLADSLR